MSDLVSIHVPEARALLHSLGLRKPKPAKHSWAPRGDRERSATGSGSLTVRHDVDDEARRLHVKAHAARARANKRVAVRRAAKARQPRKTKLRVSVDLLRRSRVEQAAGLETA